MAFVIKFQNNASEPIRVDKDLTDILTATGAFRDECSIMNPVILVEGSLVNFTKVNYCTIEELGRSYFVTDITSYRNNLLSITCRVDVISSFKTEIRANRGIVHRQENRFNLYLDDGSLHVYGNPIINTVEFPNGFTGNSYVLTVSGSRGVAIEFQGGEYLDELSAAGAGNTEAMKTTSGLITYAMAQVGKPYWFGTYGQIADQDLLDKKSYQYKDYYTATDFASQFGQKVHDCVGLIKGYRWCSAPTTAPTYVASEDVNVRGLWSQCNRKRANIYDENPWPGAVVFADDLSHCGVYIGDGYVVEARSHALGVQQNLLSERPFFTKWGVPDWMAITATPPL